MIISGQNTCLDRINYWCEWMQLTFEEKKEKKYIGIARVIMGPWPSHNVTVGHQLPGASFHVVRSADPRRRTSGTSVSSEVGIRQHRRLVKGIHWRRKSNCHGNQWEPLATSTGTSKNPWCICGRLEFQCKLTLCDTSTSSMCQNWFCSRNKTRKQNSYQ